MQTSRSADGKTRPPGPGLGPSEDARPEALRPVPELGKFRLIQTLRFFRDPFTLTAKAHERLGEIFSLRLLGLGHWIFLGSPELVREMFRAPEESLAAGEVNRELLGFVLGNDATFTLDGAAHTLRRRALYPTLNGRQAEAQVGRMAELVSQEIASWPRGSTFPLWPRMQQLALKILVAVLLGPPKRERIAELAGWFHRFSTECVHSPLMFLPALRIDLGAVSPWGRALRLRRRVCSMFEAELERMLLEKASTPKPVLARLAAGRGGSGASISRQALLDETMNLLFAGHESTGAILTWTVESVLSRPTVLTAIRRELDQVLGPGTPGAEELSRLPYLDAVISESIRFRPIAPMAGVRRARREHGLGGYRIPQGAYVAQCFPVMSRRPELFPDPDRFRPARFLGRKGQPGEWNPFGGGRRQCVGQGLGWLELKTVLALTFRDAGLELRQTRVRPVRQGFFFGPSQGLRVGRPPQAEGS